MFLVRLALENVISHRRKLVIKDCAGGDTCHRTVSAEVADDMCISAL